MEKKEAQTESDWLKIIEKLAEINSQNQKILLAVLETNNSLLSINRRRISDPIKEYRESQREEQNLINGRIGVVLKVLKKINCDSKLIEKIKQEDISGFTLFDDNIYNDYKNEKFLIQKYSINKANTKKVNTKKVSNEDIISTKKEKFINDLKPYIEKYGRDMCNDFYRYWGEKSTINPKKLKYEMEKSWELTNRLATWKTRSWNKTTNTNNKQILGKDEK